jgi:hypothetical protein
MIAAMAYPLRTRCKFGHTFTDARDARGARTCHCCERRRDRARRARRRAAACPVDTAARAAEFTGGGALAGRRKPSDVYVVAPVKPVPRGERAVVLCDVGSTASGHYGSRYFYGFLTVAEALEFARIMPCPNSACAGLHLIAWRRDRRIGSAIIGDTPRRRPLATELAALYRRPEAVPPVEFWPTPADLNEPLTPRARIAL